jgi:hypothetical protein
MNAFVRRIGVGVAAFLLSLAILPWQFVKAQTVNGAFHGTITDASGAVIPSTSIVVKNQGTGAIREMTSNDSGYYAITQLPPAQYSITATKGGFKAMAQTDVQLLVNEDREVSFVLQVGRVSQQVQVTAAAAALQTSTSTLGTVIGTHQVMDLPLNGRQFSHLILLSPGSVPVGGDQHLATTIISFGAGGISPTVDGQTGRENNFTLDGNQNNEIFRNIWAINPPPDAIQEFKVETNAIESRGGMTVGANVNVVTKSGGEQIHGDVWEFLRNDKLNAANFFTNLAGQKVSAYKQNQYGFTVGGPVLLPTPEGIYDGRKAKTFFFAYYEGFRSSQAATLLGSVPTPGELGGNFSDMLTTKGVANTTDDLGRSIMQGQIYNPTTARQVTAGQVDPVTGLTATATGVVREPFAGNVIPSTMLNKAALTYLKAFYPLPNYGPGGNSFPNLAVSSPQVIKSDQFSTKIDHAFRNHDTLFGAFYFTQPTETLSNMMLLGTNVLINHARMVGVGYTHMFNPTTLLMVHYGYILTNFTRGTQPAGLALLQATNQAPIEPVRNGLPLVPQITSFGPRITATTAQVQTITGPDRNQIFNIDFQKVTGRHIFSAGALWYHIHAFTDNWHTDYTFNQNASGAIATNGANVSSTGDGLASMLLDLPTNYIAVLGRTSANIHTLWQGYFLEDKWQVMKKLTVTAGLRYDFVAPFHWANNQISAWSNNCGCFLISQPYGVGYPSANVRPTYFDPQYRGFQPRLGLAYKITPKIVMRTGFGLFDDHAENLVQETQNLRQAWPFAVTPSLTGVNNGMPSVYFDNPPLGCEFRSFGLGPRGHS